MMMMMTVDETRQSRDDEIQRIGIPRKGFQAKRARKGVDLLMPLFSLAFSERLVFFPAPVAVRVRVWIMPPDPDRVAREALPDHDRALERRFASDAQPRFHVDTVEAGRRPAYSVDAALERRPAATDERSFDVAQAVDDRVA